MTASDGQMFSKSKGNGVDPLEIIESGYGADALRTYLMFAAPLDQWVRWDPQGVPGAYRFLARLWNLVNEYITTKPQELNDARQDTIRRIAHQTAKKVTEDIEVDHYNTAIAAAMSCINELYKIKTDAFGKHEVWQQALEYIVASVAPFAPHITEELWHQLGHSSSVHVDTWPAWNEQYLVEDTVKIAVQVNGKLRGEISVPSAATEEQVIDAAKADSRVQIYLQSKEPRKVIYVPQRLVNFVT